MIFYPIFQSTIQLQSTLIYSILDIKNFVMIICLTSLIGLPVSLLFVSNNNIIRYALDLGAVGLSLKLLLLGFVTSEIIFYYLYKKHSIVYDLSLELFY